MPHHLPAASPAGPAHIPALDGIRALAILLVIPHNLDLLRPPLPLAAYPAALLMHSGWIGVQLFFVLSGFLITGNLLDARGSRNYFSAFFGRRALRILPLYYSVLVLTFVVVPLLGLTPPELAATTSHQIWLWTFLVNWTAPFGLTVYGFGHFWSLAVEEQFYLAWPLIVLCFAPRALWKVCLGVIVGALLLRTVLLAAHAPSDAIYMFTFCRMDSLAFGAAAAVLVRSARGVAWLRSSTGTLALTAIGVFGITLVGTSELATTDPRTQSLGYTTLSLVFTLLILLATVPTTGLLGMSMRLLAWKPLRLVGRYSYGMYIFHLPLHVFFGMPLLHRLAPRVTPLMALGYVLIMTLAIFLLAALSFELFERRFLRLKHRFEPLPPVLAATVD
jgi:peptidoglycan/LPS O-acetylase OafA/YrhL